MTRSIACLLVPLALVPAPLWAEDVTVFAAASLQGALDQVARSFTDETGTQVIVSYGGSGALAKQILNGAPADIFLSAAPEWMEAVEAGNLVVPGTRKDFWGNDLVLIAHGADQPPLDLSKPSELLARLKDRPLSMALIDAVPAGSYGKAALDHLGLWDSVSDRIVQSDNVRAALNFVALGESELGIVYATDAHASAEVSLVATFPADSHPAIRYPGALLAGAKDAADQAFLDYLSTDAAKNAFAAQGFKTGD